MVTLMMNQQEARLTGPGVGVAIQSRARSDFTQVTTRATTICGRYSYVVEQCIDQLPVLVAIFRYKAYVPLYNVWGYHSVPNLARHLLREKAQSVSRYPCPAPYDSYPFVSPSWVRVMHLSNSGTPRWFHCSPRLEVSVGPPQPSQ